MSDTLHRSPCDLAGIGVLVTRPAHQCEGLCRLIAQCGGRAQVFPAMEILPPRDSEQARALLARAWDLVIFISSNAVRFALTLGPAGMLPAAKRMAVVGRGTARALEAAGARADLMPERHDSEGLLNLPELSRVDGQRVLIVRGEGGRPLLGDVLVERGADLSYAEVYRRMRPVADAASLRARWERDVGVVTATSVEILENLRELLGKEGYGRLCATPLVVVSVRMLRAAEEMGIERIIRAEGASDTALLEVLCRLAGDA